jgi:hypothetical protein
MAISFEVRSVDDIEGRVFGALKERAGSGERRASQ